MTKLQQPMKLLLSLCLITLLALTQIACSPQDSSQKSPQESAQKPSQESGSDLRSQLFAMYNKVSLEGTRKDVETSLGVTGIKDTHGENGFNYMDKDGKYGVYVTYDSKDNTMSKTVLFHEETNLASLTPTPVTKEQGEKIKEGDTYESVKTLLGGDGIEVNVTEIPFEGNKTVKMFRWCNKDNTGLQIIMSTSNTVARVNYFDSQ